MMHPQTTIRVLEPVAESLNQTVRFLDEELRQLATLTEWISDTRTRNQFSDQKFAIVSLKVKVKAQLDPLQRLIDEARRDLTLVKDITETQTVLRPADVDAVQRSVASLIAEVATATETMTKLRRRADTHRRLKKAAAITAGAAGIGVLIYKGYRLFK